MTKSSKAARRSTYLAWALLACACAFQAGPVSAADPKASKLYEDALSRFEKKDLPGAIIQLKNALKIDRSLLPVHALLGRALLGNGEAVAAEVALDEAVRLGVNRAEVVIPLARAVVAQGRAKDLLEQPRFSDAGLPAGVRVELLLMKASAASDLGDSRTSLQFITTARALEPRAETWLAEVPVRVRARQFAEATAAADKALALNPGSAEAIYLRGTIAHVRGDLPAALAQYDKALLAAPNHVEARVSRAGLLLDQVRLADAGKDLAELRKLAPIDPRAAYLRALVLEKQGDAAGARAALNEVTALLDPVPMEFIRYKPQLLMLGGLAHFGLNQREKARPYLEAVQRDQPQSSVSKLLAQIQLGANDVDRAIESLERYLRGNPNDVQAVLLLASAHMSQGRHARAATLMQESLRRQDATPLRNALGFSLVGSGKPEAAVAEFERVLKSDPGHVQAGTALAAIYLQGGQPKRALQIAESLLKRRPDHPGVLNIAGEARARAGNAAAAAEAFTRAAQLDPAFLAPQLNLARLDIDQGRFDSASSRLEAVLAKNDKQVDALMEMARLQLRRGRGAEVQRWLERADEVGGPDNLQPGLALVDFQLGNSRPDLAQAAAQRLVGKAPDAYVVLNASARVSLAQGDMAAARAALTRAAGVAGYDAVALLQVAALQMQANHLPGAAHSLDKALQQRPGLLAAEAMLADVELRQGDVGKAEQRARRIVAAHPRSGAGHGLLGDVAWRRDQRPAAIESYRRAHELDQNSASLLRLMRALMGTQPAAALQLAEAWVRTRPGEIEVQRAMADTQARTGNLRAARAAYENLLKQVPEDAEAHNNLANVLLLSGDPGAQAAADKALALKPGAAHIIGTAGWAAFKAGQTDRALQLLRDARLRDPANPGTRYFLGAVLASSGRQAEARQELQAALAAGPGFQQAGEAEKLLASLR